MPASSEPQKIRLDALDPKDLSMLQQQLQEELQSLGSSSFTLQKVAGELGASGRAVDRLGDRQQGDHSPAPTSAGSRIAFREVPALLQLPILTEAG